MRQTAGPTLADEAAATDGTHAGGEINRAAIIVALACSVCMGLSFAPLFMGTFPLFLGPVSQEFRWSAAIFPQAMLIAGLTGAVSGPFVGRLIDTLGVRKVLLPGLVAWAATVVGMSMLNGSIIQLYIVSALMGPLAATCGPVALAKIVSGWFSRGRGVALSAILGGSVAIFTAVLLVIARSLILTVGWRDAYLGLAGLIVFVALPLCYRCLREGPAAVVMPAGGIPDDLEASSTPMAAFRSRPFWTIILSSALVCASCSAIASHLLPWGAEHGISAATATFALSLYSLSGPFSALLAGWAADRVPHPAMLAGVFVVPLAGFLAMLLSNEWAVVIGVTLMGAGFAAVAGLLPFFTSRYFGLANASTIFGVAVGLTTLSLGIGPVLLGVLRDRWGAYTYASPIVVGALILAVLLAAWLPAYRRA